MKSLLATVLFILLIPVLAAGDSVPLVAPLNPDFVGYQSAASTKTHTSATPVPSLHPTGYIPSPVDYSHLKNANNAVPSSLKKSTSTAVPTAYDLRTLGRVSPVKDQGQCGDCWAFGAVASLESGLLPAELDDFSENNLKNTSGFDWCDCCGGNDDMSMAYFARWSGPVLEATDPYNPTSSYSPPNLPPDKHLMETQIIPPRSGPLDNDAIKNALMTYGAIAVTFFVDSGAESSTQSSYYNPATASYYYNGSPETNHEVAIVGWDDNYPASNFSTTPPGNGAFIVKNSWGASWGNGGYFYISYYDTNIGQSNCIFTDAEQTTNYDRIYQYDPLGMTTGLGFNSITGWFANIFAAQATEQLNAIAFYTSDVSTSYNLFVYTGVSAGTPLSGTLTTTQSGTFANPGYHTVILTTPVMLNNGGPFSVVIQVTGTSYVYPIPIEMPISGYSSNATANAGESFVSADGSNWSDITTWYANTNVCVKAFTGQNSITAPGAPAGVTATVGNTQSIVSFTPPAPNGSSPITLYTVTSTPGGITATGTASPITVTGLTNGTTYSFTVTATDSVGVTSVPSSASNSVTPATIPCAPTIVTATAGNALATVAFTLTPPASDGGSPITGYTATSNPGSFTGTGTTSPITVSGLTNGTTYTFTVTATNSVGTSLPSSASNSVTPITIPYAPTIVTATAGNALATVAFTPTPPASNGGSPITGYTAISNPGSFTGIGTTSPITVSGLTNGTVYTFTVTATNSVGTSLPSSASNSVTPITIPGAPTIGAATAGNAQAMVAFTPTPPASNGGSPITGYTATSNPGSFTGTGTTSPITVSGLTNGTVYTFTVTATNAAGTGPPSGISNRVTPKPSAISFVSGPHGKITGTNKQLVNYGGSTTQVTAVPATGYYFVNWTGTNGFVTTTANPLIVTDVTVSQTITANFTINQYVLNFNAGAGGTITGTTPQTVNYGGSATKVSANPETGYHFVNWTGDNGFATSKTNPLNVKNVKADHNITANFAINQYTMTFAAGLHGSITGTKKQTVNYGGSTTEVTATPNAGYSFVNWTGTNGFVTTTDNPLTMTDVTTTQTIKANFAK